MTKDSQEWNPNSLISTNVFWRAINPELIRKTSGKVYRNLSNGVDNDDKSSDSTWKEWKCPKKHTRKTQWQTTQSLENSATLDSENGIWYQIKLIVEYKHPFTAIETNYGDVKEVFLPLLLKEWVITVEQKEYFTQHPADLIKYLKQQLISQNLLSK